MVFNDTYLLCSDGVTSMLTDQEIAKTLATMTDTQQAGKELLSKARAAGGYDNITLVLMTVSGVP